MWIVSLEDSDITGSRPPRVAEHIGPKLDTIPSTGRPTAAVRRVQEISAPVIAADEAVNEAPALRTEL
jgi:hypothetical protein